MIILKNISKTYFRGGVAVKAVDNASIEIKDGEIFGVIGYSGAGKSTLVRCINLLERPDEGGRVEVGALELTSLKPAALREVRSKIGMIFQHFNLMASRTVLERSLSFAVQRYSEKKASGKSQGAFIFGGAWGSFT